MRIQVKTPEQIELMRLAGRLVGETLELVREAVKPGVTTLDLDQIAEENIRSQGGIPSFIGVPGPVTAFPATLCTSVNEEIVHCIPRADKVLREGDIVSIDCGAIVDGWHGDAAITVPVGEVSAAVQKLLDVTEESLWLGMAAARGSGHLNDIGHRWSPTSVLRAPTASSRAMAGTASAPRCTWTLSSPTSARRAPA